jgi:hypothetical protein
MTLLAVLKSAVANPSLKRPYTGANSTRACATWRLSLHNRARLVAVRSSQECAPCCRAMSSDRGGGPYVLTYAMVTAFAYPGAGRKAMRRREFIALLGNGIAALPFSALAQQPEKKYTIGILGPGPASPPHLKQAFFDELQELGWVVGKNIAVEYRYAEDQPL